MQERFFLYFSPLKKEEPEQRRNVSAAPLANHYRKGLWAKDIYEMLKLPEEEIDIGMGALLIAKERDPRLDIQKYLAQIDAMARELRARVGDEKDPKKIIAIMNCYPSKEKGYAYFSKDDRARFLDFLLDENKGQCVSLSTLYLSFQVDVHSS